MSPQVLYPSLLRPAVIHILRAAGFHATKPSVLDSLTDICARFCLLVATRIAAHAYDRTISSLREIEHSADLDESGTNVQIVPSVSDVRHGLTSAAFFGHGMSASDEAWCEVMRKPLSSYPPGAREKERRRRDLEDTEDVREFVDWVTGPIAKEIRRIAGLLQEEPSHSAIATLPSEPPHRKENYLETLKKKQSKSGDSARYHGTALGRATEDSRHVKIEGGPTTLDEWKASLKRKRPEIDD